VTRGRARAAGPAAAGSACEWEHFAHGADIGVRGRGATPAQAFEQAALAMTAVVTRPELVGQGTRVPIRCRAPDLELLLYEWLNSLVFHMATQHLLFSGFTVRIADDDLLGEARGEPVDVVRHAPAVEVKGATLTELAVCRDDDGRWRAQCVLDV
jgi:tRNA nucleotidyltransferase (CCA-adding enzyme)